MIEFKNLDVVFGKQVDQALPLLDSGVSRNEILEKTGCTAGVRNANLKVEQGEICVLMGLSGSGKSSLLRTANGLNPITRGSVHLDTENGMQDFNSLSEAEQRQVRMERITMVFQKFALMPWLTVAQNVAFGLEQKGMDKKLIREKVEEQLELVGLTPWADKKPSELSGGMQQRVGLARALAMETDIILMDEPFSALDPLIRAQLQDELLRLQAKLNKTVVFVSHDLDEALKLGNHIAIMKDGEIVQHDTPENIVLNPANDYVRDFVAHTNPVDVVKGHSLMRSLSSLEQEGEEYCLSHRHDYWLELKSGIDSARVRLGDQFYPVHKWDGEGSIETLPKQPAMVPVETIMKDIMELRYHTGHGVLLHKNDKVVGYVGDKDIYHALLGKLLDED
ncbi:choline ABC transporter ATP-binding protein [Bermanella marisrubri]|uniref:ABC-type proline/glycine betaine transport system, ATPase component n=1 Tax=Bermanella marisrubri TaxID=207949 RepID=Q1N6L5_9GAMM|nr:choline ABC transporter ATP-binding protein [Bermanella marisrubri]EAT13577.1 ABC-type proline/glycine betaine transport system, ATPase component [Oceanobacter sp. RED65] [Bermanella marisrubri]QIZ84368.1 choline ABC transporter ATP-binding protein [Bermanella marisrubri]